MFISAEKSWVPEIQVAYEPTRLYSLTECGILNIVESV
jgi:hypothetical protein